MSGTSWRQKAKLVEEYEGFKQYHKKREAELQAELESAQDRARQAEMAAHHIEQRVENNAWLGRQDQTAKILELEARLATSGSASQTGSLRHHSNVLASPTVPPVTVPVAGLKFDDQSVLTMGTIDMTLSANDLDSASAALSNISIS